MSLVDFTPHGRFLMSKPIRKKDTMYINFRDRADKTSRVRLEYSGPVTDISETRVSLGESKECIFKLAELREYVLQTAVLNSERWFGREMDWDGMDGHTPIVGMELQVDSKLSEIRCGEELLTIEQLGEMDSLDATVHFYITGICVERKAMTVTLTLDRMVVHEKDINEFEEDDTVYFPKAYDSDTEEPETEGPDFFTI